MENQEEIFYRYHEIITDQDLHSIYHGFRWQLKNLKWYQFRYKIELTLAINVIDKLHIWIHQGKPAIQTANVPRGGHYEN